MRPCNARGVGSWNGLGAVVVVLVACCLLGTARAQPPVFWTQRVVSGPPGLGDVSMAFHFSRGVAVLFGGTTDGYNGYDQTWEWNGSSWTNRAVSGPPARLLTAMAYDTIRDVTVLFGGINQNTIYGDTWEWDGTQWAS